MITLCLPSPRYLCIWAAFFCALWAGSNPTASANSSANPYDALGQVLHPLAATFSSKSSSRGFALELELAGATDLPSPFVGKRLAVQVLPPDRALLRVAVEGESWAMGRSGQKLWVAPGSKLTAVVPLPEPRQKKKKKAHGIASMELPFSPAQLSFLPILFTVKEGPPSDGARMLMVRLMPEIARNLGVEEWSARLFLSREDGRLLALELARPDWQVRVNVLRLEIAPAFPPSSWEPLPEEEADLIRLTGDEARRWLEHLGEKWLGGRSR